MLPHVENQLVYLVPMVGARAKTHRLRCYPLLWEVWRVSVKAWKDNTRLGMPGWLGLAWLGLRVLECCCAVRTWTRPACTASTRCFKLCCSGLAIQTATVRCRCLSNSKIQVLWPLCCQGRSFAAATSALQNPWRHIVHTNDGDMRMLV
jgi:hypothetical protein